MTALALVAAEPPSIALEVFTAIPPWARAHAVKDNSTMPLFRQGEVAVFADEPKSIPEHGKLYVVEYGGNPIAPGHSTLTRRTCSLAEAHKHLKRDGEAAWSFRSYAGPIHWADGWYPDEYMMADKVLGPVVGIYAPSGSAAS
ncbi:hypothetical protein [Sphingomonas sp. VDB2]|uniref:hypothetical protein n=1 Tax=Sphingomonas sp. VDB2 TaxID=3228751 RepID=UPI003A80EE9B